MEILDKIIAFFFFLQLTTVYGRYARQPSQNPSYILEQQLGNSKVPWNYGDSLNFNFPDIPISSHNYVEKPIEEPQEYVPPQSIGSASIPLMPPPAVPVNAVASNVPISNGATYLGSGSIGVVALGNGAFALGSGSLGYSDGRGQPRPSTSVPVYPRLPPSPNLIPAAVPSQPDSPSYQPVQTYPQFDYSFTDQMQNQNNYEMLRASGFGTPVVRPPRPLRMHFATPTVPVQATNAGYTLTITPEIPESNEPEQYNIMRHY